MDCSDWEPFEETEHTADLALVARGRDLRELILNASRGVVHLIADATGLTPDEWVSVAVSGSDPERLLVGFIKEILVEWELHGGVPVAVEVKAAPDSAWLNQPGEGAEVRGRVGLADPSDADERIRAIPKAATYHGLQIQRVGDLLEAALVLDT
jgi:SHS2 domain-containing protein